MKDDGIWFYYNEHNLRPQGKTKNEDRPDSLDTSESGPKKKSDYGTATIDFELLDTEGEQSTMSNSTQIMLGLVVGVFLLVFLVLKTKIHTFLALILASSATGLIGGLMPADVINNITGGFGSTLSSIGIIIGFGVMMGRILEVSGAAERMAYTFVKILGKGKEEWAMAFTGLVVSIPIFADSGFVILTPLFKALSKRTKRSVVGMGTALAAGLIITHHLVPPTPGPLGVAGIFGADVGMVILWGIAFSIPLVLVGIAYAKYNGRKIYQIPSDDGLSWERPDEIQEEEMKELNIEEMFPNLDKMPGTAVSFAPIIVPIILIFLNTLTAALGVEGMASQIFTFIGSPTIAVAIGLILAIYTLAGNEKREDVLNQMEEGVASAGIILLITGAGGAFGYIIRSTGIGDYLAQVIAGLPIPAILIPFAIATVIRLIQGSGTVSMITAASISAPILSTLNVNPVFATISACMGAMVFSYFNDSFFWVVNRMMGITDVKEQIKTWSVPTTIIWGVGGVLVLIVNAIFG